MVFCTEFFSFFLKLFSLTNGGILRFFIRRNTLLSSMVSNAYFLAKKAVKTLELTAF